MKQAKRLLTLLICAVTLLSSASCSQNTDQGKAAQDNTSQSETQAEASDTAEQQSETEPSASVQIAEKYSSYDLGGLTYTILAPDKDSHWIYSGRFNEVTADSMNGEIVNDSLYERNRALEELLDVKLSVILESSTSSIASKASKSVTAGDNAYDLVLCTMTSQADNTLKGCYLNALELPIDFTSPWWDQKEIEAFTYDGRLYWLCGDINIGDDYACQVLFVNKRLLGDYGYELPYSKVNDGSWTIDYFETMALAAKSDLDGDGDYDIDDQWGLVECNDHIKHWIYSMGERMVEVDGDAFVLNVQSEHHIEVVNRLFDFFVTDGAGYLGNINVDVTVFTSGRCLFHSTQLLVLELLRDMEDEFGILPLPKYNEEQENYGAYISNGGATAFSIPVTVASREDSAAVVDAMCGLSTDTLRSAFYDVLFSSKYVRDVESVEMLDIIFENKNYDWGVDFSWSSLGGIYQNLITKQQNTYVSDIAAKIDSVQAKFDKLGADLKELG